MASNNSDYNSYIPQWKKELILRRRAFGRAITSAGGMVKLTVTCPSSLRPDSLHLSCSRQPHCPFQPGNCTAQQDFHPECSVRNMRLLDTDLSSDLIVSGVKCNSDCVSDVKVKMVEEKPAKKPSFRGMEKQKEEKQLRALSGIKFNGKEEGYQSDSSEELQYGPGIVNKLKSKYLSMTLRDNQKHSSRPSLANLRRATSLENMLDDDTNRSQDKPHFIKKAYHSSTYKGAKISQHHAKYLGLTRGSESMKRARSMDTLLKNDSKVLPFQSKPLLNKSGISNGIIAPSIINEDIIIVDNSSHTEEEKCNYIVEDKEMPPPDVVKQTVKIFEPSKDTKPTESQGKKNVSLKSSNTNTAKINNIEKPVPKLGKPSLSPKPILSPEKRLIRPKVSSPKRVVPVVTPIKESSKSSLPLRVFEKEKEIINDKEKEVTSSVRIPSSPIKSPPFKNVTHTVKAPTLTLSTNGAQPSKGSFDKTPPSSPVKSSSPIKGSPVPPVLTSPSHNNNVDFVNDDSKKYISQKAMEGICKEGTSVTFSFSESPVPLNKSYLPTRNVAQATNTTLISSQGEHTPPNSPPSDTVMSPSKQVAVIRPVLASKTQNLTEVEIEKNLINTVKTIETRIISTKNEVEPTYNCASEKTQLWDKKPWQSQNTMVFNFSSRDSVPDYIENDGLNQTKRTAKVSFWYLFS